ncbi:pseudouridine synthase [Phellopilus nigrolimitatus]|nr:pseudouridine synthase [Phellopilus nigrolimitatus]
MSESPALASSNCDARSVRANGRPGLKKIPPYWYPYRTNAKARWFDREILELVSTEFRDRSVEYYRYALQSGVTTINGKIALPGTVVRNGDTLENIVHRHEPPVTSTPVEILYRDKERNFVVINKPGSIPVHAAGRYFKNSLVEILKDDFGFANVYTVNRLDRLTSGLMIIALSADCARTLTSEFTNGTIHKEYVARVQGEFPAEEITCEEPLLTVDRQMGLNIVHPEGKTAKTVFTRMHYDKITDTSVVHCRPFTGRSHQIRVHLQYLGHPIANDTVYAETKIWGSRLGKGGIDIAPSEERVAPKPPPEHADSTAEGRGRGYLDSVIADRDKQRNTQLVEGCSENGTSASALVSVHSELSASSEDREETNCTGQTTDATGPTNLNSKKKWNKDKQNNPAFRTKEESAARRLALKDSLGTAESPALLPRETGHDIGLGASVPLSLEAVGVITRLRNQKDQDEDWSRWRDVVFRAKGMLHPKDIALSWAQQEPGPSADSSSKRRKGTGKQKKKEKRVEGDLDPVSDMVTGATETEAGATEVIREPNTNVPQLTRPLVSPSSTPVSPTQPKALLVSDPAPPPSDSAPVFVPSLDTSISSPISASYDSKGAPERADGRVTNHEADNTDGALYCPECYLPLHPDPKPEKLYIFLHALRYTSESLGAFETRLPEWAAEGYEWE